MNRNTLHLCSGWTTGPHTVLILRGVGGGVPTLGALEAAILLLHSPQTLRTHTVQTEQEVGVSQLTSALHTEEGGLRLGLSFGADDSGGPPPVAISDDYCNETHYTVLYSMQVNTISKYTSVAGL